MAPIPLISETCTDLPKVSPGRRREIVKQPVGRAEHARLVAGIEALGRIEARAPARTPYGQAARSEPSELRPQPRLGGGPHALTARTR